MVSASFDSTLRGHRAVLVAVRRARRTAERRGHANLVRAGADAADHDHVVVDAGLVEQGREVVDVRLNAGELLAHAARLVDDDDDVDRGLDRRGLSRRALGRSRVSRLAERRSTVAERVRIGRRLESAALVRGAAGDDEGGRYRERQARVSCAFELRGLWWAGRRFGGEADRSGSGTHQPTATPEMTCAVAPRKPFLRFETRGDFRGFRWRRKTRVSPESLRDGRPGSRGRTRPSRGRRRGRGPRRSTRSRTGRARPPWGGTS